MNYTLRNIIGIALTLFIIIFGYYYLFARQQGQYVPESWGDLDCMYPVMIGTDALEPTLRKGSILMLNQCIPDKDDLEIDYIVSFNYDGVKRIGSIKDVIYIDRKVSYIVTTHNDGTGEYTISSEDVLAYTKL